DAKDFHSLNWVFEIDFQLGRRGDAEASLKLFADEVRAGMGHLWRGQYVAEVGRWLELTGQHDRADELLAPLATPVPPPTKAPGHAHGAELEEAPFELFEAAAVADVRLGAAARRHDPAAAKRLAADSVKVEAQLRPFLEHQLGKEQYAKMLRRRELGRAATLAEARGD